MRRLPESIQICGFSKILSNLNNLYYRIHCTHYITELRIFATIGTPVARRVPVLTKHDCCRGIRYSSTTCASRERLKMHSVPFRIKQLQCHEWHNHSRKYSVSRRIQWRANETLPLRRTVTNSSKFLVPVRERWEVTHEKGASQSRKSWEATPQPGL